VAIKHWLALPKSVLTSYLSTDLGGYHALKPWPVKPWLLRSHKAKLSAYADTSNNGSPQERPRPEHQENSQSFRGRSGEAGSGRKDRQNRCVED